MHKNRFAALTACSDGLSSSQEKTVENLTEIISELFSDVLKSEYIYDKKTHSKRNGRLRAAELMSFYRDDRVSDIFDISGGDLANEVIPYLDFDIIKNEDKTFWGYSDLTTIINAIYSKTGKASILYQIRKTVESENSGRKEMLVNAICSGGEELFRFPYEFVRGNKAEGIVVGGNIRCFLKLAGTDCFPDLNGKILLLESLGGYTPQMITYLSQLKMMGAFEKIKGIILGTFTKLDEAEGKETIINLVTKYADEKIPVLKTDFIGHGADSYAVRIGERYIFER